jgi:hypothetical protein
MVEMESPLRLQDLQLPELAVGPGHWQLNLAVAVPVELVGAGLLPAVLGLQILVVVVVPADRIALLGAQGALE